MVALYITTVVSGCAVQIKNQRWYGDEGPKGAVWFETQTTATGHLTKEEWDAARVGMACSLGKNFIDTKAALEKLCHDTGECVYINDPQVQAFFSRVIQATAQDAKAVADPEALPQSSQE